MAPRIVWIAFVAGTLALSVGASAGFDRTGHVFGNAHALGRNWRP